MELDVYTIVILVIAALILLSLPALKAKAKATPNVLDDKIVTMLGLWAKSILPTKKE